jgi:hypothetical protein
MRESTVTLLPPIKEREFAALFHPTIAGDFNLFDKIGE